jgi:hypothetical protein
VVAVVDDAMPHVTLVDVLDSPQNPPSCWCSMG